MKKIFKWFAIVVGSVVGLLVLVIVTTNVMANTRMNRLYDVNAPVVAIPDDEAALERGKHLVEVVSQCSGCHAPDLGGDLFMDDPMVGVIPAPNLTSGQGGVGAYYTDVDWTRALVHGVAPDGRMLLVMPSQYFRHYSDEDLGAVIAYLKHVSPVDRAIESRQLGLMGNTFFGLGLFGTMPAEIIDHLSARPKAPQTGETAEYGQYLVNIAVCRDCHGENLAGSRPSPDSPWGSNLTRGGALLTWSEEDFVNAMRTGIRPDGRVVVPFMPWDKYRYMTDEELRAIWLYLHDLPALEDNQQ